MTTLLVWLAVGIALWQLHRRTAREREAAVQRERLRIARDMHDHLGRRLGLAAVQAGALEVAAGDPETRAAARRFGDAVR
ncbi:histidine kinase, partial [Glycomyces tenuis]